MKQIFTFLFFIVLSCNGLLKAQDNLSFKDDNLQVSSQIEKMSDESNDRFYDFYKFTFKNTSDSKVSFVVSFKYKIDDQLITSDSSEKITLNPGESISGDRDSRRDLTLFKSFNIGNSGKKLSEKNVEFVSFNIIYL